MPTIQTSQQFLNNVQEVAARCLPSVLANTSANVNFINGFLLAHFTDGKGFTDASSENLYQAILTLHREGKLQWEEGKAPRKVVHERPILREVDPLGMQARHLAIVAANKSKEASDAQLIIDRCRSTARNFTGQSHSVSYGGREILSKKLDAELKKTPTPDLARAIEIEGIIRETAKECHR